VRSRVPERGRLFDAVEFRHGASSERLPALAVAGENARGNGGLLAPIVFATVQRDFLEGWRSDVGRSRGRKAGIVGVVAGACTLGAVGADTVAVANLCQAVVDGLDFIAADADRGGDGGDRGLILRGRLAGIALLPGPSRGGEEGNQNCCEETRSFHKAPFKFGLRSFSVVSCQFSVRTGNCPTRTEDRELGNLLKVRFAVRFG